MIEWYLPPAGAPDGWPWTTRGYHVGMGRRPRKPVRCRKARKNSVCQWCGLTIIMNEAITSVGQGPWVHIEHVIEGELGLAQVVGQDPAVEGAAVVAGPSGVPDSDTGGGGDVGGVNITGSTPAPAKRGY